MNKSKKEKQMPLKDSASIGNKARKIKSIMDRIPLKTSIFISLQMDDYDNWKDGEYLGDNEKIIKQTEWILKEVFSWVDNGMPGGRDMDLSEYKNLKGSGLVNVSKKK
jgi:hypothetical protein